MESVSFLFLAAILIVTAGIFVAAALSARSKSSGVTGGMIRPSGRMISPELSRLEAKLDVLLQHFDLTAEAEAKIKQTMPDYGVPPEVLAFLPDKKIEAIKLMRSMSGLTLKEAKDKVDEACSRMRH